MQDRYLSITDLLDQDLSSYEYFQTLSADVKRSVMERDVRSFEELQDLAGRLTGR